LQAGLDLGVCGVVDRAVGAPDEGDEPMNTKTLGDYANVLAAIATVGMLMAGFVAGQSIKATSNLVLVNRALIVSTHQQAMDTAKEVAKLREMLDKEVCRGN
jgi:hypothetical protein